MRMLFTGFYAGFLGVFSSAWLVISDTGKDLIVVFKVFYGWAALAAAVVVFSHLCAFTAGHSPKQTQVRRSPLRKAKGLPG
ncbi:hypothetical protein NRB16_15895 [Pseudomonas sp. LJDD11]|uniref:hypothetical protein n=1 Tax=Pseudomonas sp. LJDD11 TaxID=2931984 RepID=UPI00211C58CF|nr:hypothetical protein [Pseudomonas sp. LJDD11]MCQ9425002.1 hypothetical protein [Pseudomonas sp. LJDD11]